MNKYFIVGGLLFGFSEVSLSLKSCAPGTRE